MSPLVLPLFACCTDLPADASVGRVVLSFATLGVVWDEMGFDEVVELVQVDSAEDRRKNASLGCTTQRCVVAPFLQISRLEQVFDEAQETLIVDFLGQSLQEDGMIQLVETGFDVSLYEPVRAFPRLLDLAQSGVTSTLRAKSMREVTELWFVICLHEATH